MYAVVYGLEAHLQVHIRIEGCRHFKMPGPDFAASKNLL